MRKLTVVVTCTQRKSLPIDPGLSVRELPVGSAEERSAAWSYRIRTADATRPLRDLYQGGSWALVPGLAAAATAAGYSPRILVASAGLGLREVDSSAPAYGATFSSGSDDVVGERTEHGAWWESLGELPGSLSPREALRGRVLLLLSAPYASAMHQDLTAIGQRTGERLLVGGAAVIPGITRLPADGALRSTLGGTNGSLIIRTATAWMQRLGSHDLTDEKAMSAWQTWAQTTRRPETWDRKPQSDQAVRDFIRSLLRQNPSTSRTRALRALRDAGLACEQQRFATIFTTVGREA